MRLAPGVSANKCGWKKANASDTMSLKQINAAGAPCVFDKYCKCGWHQEFEIIRATATTRYLLLEAVGTMGSAKIRV